MAAHVIYPSEKLRTKFVYYVVIVLVLFFLPWTLLALAPGLGLTFVLIYLGANVLWVIVTLLLIGPYCRSISYGLHDDEVVVRKGIITKTVQTMPYRTITNVEVKRGPLDRLLGIGGIHIHSAGYSQQTGAEITLGGLTDYEAVEEQLYAALRRYRAAGALGEPVPAPVEEGAPAGEQAVLLRRILDELRGIRGALSTRSERAGQESEK